MNFTYSGGTAQQRAWVQEAIGDCSYPLSWFASTTATVHFTDSFPNNLDTTHPYMATVCTTTIVSGKPVYSFDIYVKTWADDPNNPQNQGLPNPPQDIHDFYRQSFVHELGHVVSDLTFDPGGTGSDKRVPIVCALFWRTKVGVVGGREYGTTAEYESGAWPDEIREAVAECFKCGFYTGRLIFNNRTNWHIDEKDWATLMAYLSAKFEYLAPIAIGGYQEVEAEDYGLKDPYTTSVSLGPMGLLINYAAPWAAEWPKYAIDMTASLTGIESGGAQVIKPTVFGAGTHFISYSAHNGDYLPGTEDYSPFDWNQKMSVGELWDQQGDNPQPVWTGKSEVLGVPPPGTDGPARSGWQVRRANGYAFTLDPSLRAKVAWGLLEIKTQGQKIVSQGRDDTGFSLLTFSSCDMVNGDRPNPWNSDTSLIVGNGPWFDGGPPVTHQNGWVGGGATYYINSTMTSSGFEATATGFTGIQDFVYIPPQNPRPPPPGAPSDLPTDGSVTWNYAEVDDLTAGYAFPVSPLRSKFQYEIVWDGYSAEVDNISQLHAGARFFPVKPLYPVDPPYPFPLVASSMFVGRTLRGAVPSLQTHGRLAAGAELGVLVPTPTQAPTPHGATPGKGFRGAVDLNRLAVDRQQLLRK